MEKEHNKLEEILLSDLFHFKFGLRFKPRKLDMTESYLFGFIHEGLGFFRKKLP